MGLDSSPVAGEPLTALVLTDTTLSGKLFWEKYVNNFMMMIMYNRVKGKRHTKCLGRETVV